MLDIKYTSQFKKDVKKKYRQGSDLGKIDEVILALREQKPLPERNRDHELSGVYRGHGECHVEPDWLLIYRVDEDSVVLMVVRTRSYSELLGM